MRSLLLTAASMLGVATFPGLAIGAPQALLLVAQGEDVQLFCQDSECAAEVTTICLQPKRAIPVRGTKYLVIEDPRRDADKSAALSLLGRSPGGSEVELPATHLRIAAERDHSAVMLSVPRAVLRSFGLSGVTVRISRRLALAPVSVEGDPAPQTAADLARANGPLRRLAEQVLASYGERVAAVRVVRDVINALPHQPSVSEAGRSALWRRALDGRANGNSSKISSGALRHVGDAFRFCLGTGADRLGDGSRDAYRDCLGLMHDGLINRINGAYWEALKIGS